jgi:hypothetical protein
VLVLSRENAAKDAQKIRLEGLSALCDLAKLGITLAYMTEQIRLEIPPVIAFLEKEAFDVKGLLPTNPLCLAGCRRGVLDVGVIVFGAFRQ